MRKYEVGGREALVSMRERCWCGWGRGSKGGHGGRGGLEVGLCRVGVCFVL